MRTLKLTKDSQKNILESLLKRSPNNYTEYESTVNEIINNVKENRDKAVFEYTKKFDKADVDASNIRVTEEEIKEAYELVDEKLLAVIKKALVNIRKYHEKQLQNSWFTTEDGIILGQKVTPIAKAGVYVPGGKAVYPSSVLMNVLPAKVAGVEKIVMCTPCGADGKVYPSTPVAPPPTTTIFSKACFSSGSVQVVAFSKLINKVSRKANASSTVFMGRDCSSIVLFPKKLVIVPAAITR